MTPVSFFELVLALLAGAVALSLLAGRLRLPPAAALVVGGMVLAVVPQVPSLTLDPDLILVLFLPPLLVSSAYQTAWRDFTEELRSILLLSIGAVVFTTVAVGAAAHFVAPRLPWGACFALGAIVSPPDAVAAKAVLQRLSLPRRLTTILEGESLLNDASGLVLYKLAVAAVLTGMFSAWHAGASFVWVIVGGVALGTAAGFAAEAIIGRLHDTRSIIVVTFVVAWVSYIGAERIEASGVLATVACGAVMSFKSHGTLGAHERVQAGAVWQFVVFVFEALVFVLIGLALRGVLDRHGGDMSAVTDVGPLVVATIVTVVVSRIVWIYVAYALRRLVRRHEPPPPRGALPVIAWAGMRGVVTLAVALALPLSFPGRDAILVASFSVILFTVLVQGTTLGPLIAALGVHKLKAPPSSDLLDTVGTRIAINQAAVAMLEALVDETSGMLLHPQLLDEYRGRVRAGERLRDGGEARAVVRRDHFETALLALATGRDELIRLHRTRRIHDTVLRAIEDELDFEELRLKRLLEQFAA